MKALVISLQRLGDVMMATPTLELLQRRGFKVHLLINKNFRNVVPLLPNVDRVHLLDRKAIETALVEPDHAIFEAFDRLQHLLEQLRAESFDCVINLTHNSLAGRLTALVPGVEHIGLQIHGDEVSFGSAWIRYLNRLPTTSALDHFHLSDIFQFALGAKEARPGYHLRETEDGQKEWHEVRQHIDTPWILVQPFSSETKKQWHEDLLIRCLLEFERQNPTTRVLLLGAPFESDALWNLQARLKSLGSRSQMTLLSLEGALSAVRESPLLLTTDTAIKHLAAATETPVVELALGSSDPSKTGIYKSGQYILRSREICSPCPHGGDCSQPQHLCGQSLDPHAVAHLLSAVLAKDTLAIHRIARRHSHRMEVLKTHFSKSGYWMATPVYDEKEQRFRQGLEKSALKLALSLRPEEIWQEMGTEGLHFQEDFQADAKEIVNLENRLNTRIARIEQLKGRFQQVVRTANPQLDSLAGHIHALLQECELQDQHPVNGLRHYDLSALRRLQQALLAAEQKSSIQLKLIRNISFQKEEIL